VFLKFSQPWWTFTKEQGNKAVPIQYGTLPAGRKAGATGITDNKMAQVGTVLEMSTHLAQVDAVTLTLFLLTNVTFDIAFFV